MLSCALQTLRVRGAPGVCRTGAVESPADLLIIKRRKGVDA